MPKNKPAVAIAVAYKGDQLFFTVKDFMLGTDSKVVLKPESGKMTALKAALRPYDKYLPENRIDQDLYNLEKLYKQELKGKKLIKENELMLKLWYVAYPCCGRDRPAAAHGGEQ
ncbi:MAG: hypothetical protein M0D57_20800 [Sphingobacteriales bacterium JAD_PAG50586_3]|nr:MAG: hypothetical protein M0D57_20800 [Sphingobacteriales bacterium JAD_PAG50586_3]